MYKIYELIDLSNNKNVIYVGITKMSLGCRRSGHIEYMAKHGIYYFGIRLIEETTEAHRESYWINEYRNRGYELININNGIQIKKEKIKKEKTFNIKEYYKKNKDKMDAYHKNWLINNRDKWNEYQKNKKKIKKK
jgi:hypothetical protein